MNPEGRAFVQRQLTHDLRFGRKVRPNGPTSIRVTDVTVEVHEIICAPKNSLRRI